MNDILIFSHKDCLKKNNGKDHPERKERLETIINSLNEIKNINLIFKEAPLAPLNIIYDTHPRNYINSLFKSIPNQGIISIGNEPLADTFLCKYSKKAILRACGAGIEAANSIMNNNYKRIFCAVRPPGHHAETEYSNGFCFINNIAVTAKYLIKNYKIKKIAIIDFDVHHCNGTQEIFYNEKKILCASIHQYPLFPGTGTIDEKGVGNIFNIPIESGINSNKFIQIFKSKIIDVVNSFKPEIILISAGFDAHFRDPLANINLNSNDYFIITKYIVDLANKYSNGRIISFLEGGYDLLALHESIKYHISALSY